MKTTQNQSTPRLLDVRAHGLELDAATQAYMNERANLRLGKFAPRIGRVAVRLEDLNGPKGGVDTSCRIKVALDGAPAVVVEERAEQARVAFDLAMKACERAIKHGLDRRGESAGRARGSRKARPMAVAEPSGPIVTPVADGSLIDRRVGRAKENLQNVLARRRHVPVDTSQPGSSATDRKAGGGATAARNVMASAPQATSMLEDSARNRPSRKSTRRSANRVKSGTELERKAANKVQTPSARARAGSTRARAGKH